MTATDSEQKQIRRLINIAFGKRRYCSSSSNSRNILRLCEYLLCRKLQLTCDDEGEETDPVESAKILFGLGRIYRLQSPNKVALIKSAVLYNAALARQADDKRVERDLNDLCSHVLSLARSESSGHVLVDQAKKISIKLKALREMVKHRLRDTNDFSHHSKHMQKNSQEEKRIEVIDGIQEIVYKNYVEIMQNLMDWCESLLPSLPCKYALVGMGRLARKDVTPYTFFSPALVLEEGVQQQDNCANVLECFRWLWTIFEIVITNIGEIGISEDVLPFLKCPAKDEVITFIDVYDFMGIRTRSVLRNGVRLVCNQRKLCITDLIFSIGEMLSFLEDEQNIILSYGCAGPSNTVVAKQPCCFVSGSTAVYKELQRRISEEKKQLLSSTKWSKRAQAMTQMSIPSFSSPVATASPLCCEITDIVYRRLTFYVTALGKCHQITDRSTFNIIRKLREQQHINYSFAHDLLHAVAVSYQVRLEFDLMEGKRIDWNETECVEEELIVLFNKILGPENSVMFMKIVLKSRREVVRLLGLSNLSIVEKSSVLDKLISYYWFNQIQDAVGEAENLQNEGLLDFETKQVIIPLLMELGNDCLMDEKNTEALKIFQFAQSLFDDTLSRDFPEKLIECVHKHGVCLFGFYHYDEDQRTYPEAPAEEREACGMFEQELEMRLNISRNKREDLGIARCYRLLGHSCFRLREFNQSLQYFHEAKKIYGLFNEPHCQMCVRDCFRWSGMCLGFMDKDLEALHYHLQELPLRKKYSPHPDSDSLLATCYYNIAYCYFKHFDYEKALKNFENAQPIFMKSYGIDQERRVWKVPLMKGRCLAGLGRHENAIPEFQEALRLCKEFTKQPTQQHDIAMCIYNLGNSLFDLLKTEAALDAFVQAKHMFQDLNSGISVQNDVIHCEKMEKWCRERLRRFSFQHPVRIPSLNQ